MRRYFEPPIQALAVLLVVTLVAEGMYQLAIIPLAELNTSWIHGYQSGPTRWSSAFVLNLLGGSAYAFARSRNERLTALGCWWVLQWVFLSSFASSGPFPEVSELLMKVRLSVTCAMPLMFALAFGFLRRFSERDSAKTSRSSAPKGLTVK